VVKGGGRRLWDVGRRGLPSWKGVAARPRRTRIEQLGRPGRSLIGRVSGASGASGTGVPDGHQFCAVRNTGPRTTAPAYVMPLVCFAPPERAEASPRQAGPFRQRSGASAQRTRMLPRRAGASPQQAEPRSLHRRHQCNPQRATDNGHHEKSRSTSAPQVERWRCYEKVASALFQVKKFASAVPLRPWRLCGSIRPSPSPHLRSKKRHNKAVRNRVPDRVRADFDASTPKNEAIQGHLVEPSAISPQQSAEDAVFRPVQS